MESGRSTDITRIVLFVLVIGILLAGSVWTLLPFLSGLIWATTIAVATWPTLLKMQQVMWGRRGLAVTVMILLVLLLAYVLRHTAWGRHVYAVGDDPDAAELSGVNTKKVLISVYMLSGLICGFAGWALIGRIGSVSPTSGQTANIESITAVVIGGISLFGGRGSILGMLFGALIVGVFSLETKAKRWAQRTLAASAIVRGDRLDAGLIDESDFVRLVKASREFSALPLFIDDTPGITISEIADRAVAFKKENDLGLLVVDYLQLVAADERQGEGRFQEINEITARAILRDLGIG